LFEPVLLAGPADEAAKHGYRWIRLEPIEDVTRVLLLFAKAAIELIDGMQ
jgi:hypothetical protein